MKIEVFLSPALLPANGLNPVVVVTDIFRAATSICTAIAAGAKAIIAVEKLELALRWQNRGCLVAAERNTQKLEFADFGNSPSEFIPQKVKGKTIAFTTTNCTRCIDLTRNIVRNQDTVILTGAFVNISHIARYCLLKNKDISVLCAGWQNSVCMEDTLFAGALCEKLVLVGAEFANDSSQIAYTLWQQGKSNLKEFLQNTQHIKRLKDNGLQNDIDLCLAIDSLEVAPAVAVETGIIENILF